MKTLKNVMLLLLMSLMVIACNKSDDDGGEDPQGSEGTFTAKVNGTDFSGSIVANATESTGNGGTIITLLASDASGKAINILINPFDGTGTYDISDDSVFTTASYVEANASNPTNSIVWAAPFTGSGKVGEIRVSEKTATSIKGTFNFEAKLQNGDTMKTITEGQFNLTF